MVKKRYVDKRNWKEYNQKLVKRGEFYINPRFLDNWNEEIKLMNTRKIGQPFFYPESMIEFLAVLFSKGFDYRALEGIMRALSKRTLNFPVISFSQIRRRILQLNIEFNQIDNNLVVAVDGTGFKVTNRGEWIRHKWAIKRGWVKIVMMGDTKGNIIDLEIGDEKFDEREAARNLVKKHHKKIKKFMGDGLHDTKKTFKVLDRLGIEPVIKIRKNASTKSRGCMPRKKQAIIYKQKEHDQWVQETGYGYRWPASEGIFGAIKRINGETLKSHKTQNLYHEAKLKFWTYQQQNQTTT